MMDAWSDNPGSENTLVADLRKRRDFDVDEIIQSTLTAARRHLGMKVAYVSKITGNLTRYLYVDAPGYEHLIKPGDVRSLDDVFCRHILEGRIPNLLSDAACHPVTRDMAITHAVPIGAHVSIPICGSDGKVIGMFCCLDTDANPTLNARDLGIVRLFAEIAGAQLDRKLARERRSCAVRQRIERMIANRQFSSVYQPLWNISKGTIFGFECLARFPIDPSRPTHSWFDETGSVGLRTEFELAVLDVALRGAVALPADIRVSVNASASTMIDPRFANTLIAFDVSRLIIELTEYARVEDFRELRGALKPLVSLGAKVAVDDAGSGYAGLKHIVGVNADLIKLDRGLIKDIESSPVSRALISALSVFARQTGSILLAEGIETRSEFETLNALGIEYGQGNFLGQPVSMKLAIEMLNRANLGSSRTR